MNWLHHLWFSYAWPSDLGNGPEAVQQMILTAVIAVLLWPPTRKRIRLYLTRKDSELHRKLDHIIKHHPDIPDLPPKDEQ